MAAEQSGSVSQPEGGASRPPGNLRTALVLGLIAAVFFCGVIVNRIYISN